MMKTRDMSNWISVKEKDSPPMHDVLICVGGDVIMGWNESTEPEEDAAYCSCQRWPDDYISGEGVTHWMPLPKSPEGK